MNRETWLQLFIEKSKPYFAKVGAPLPDKIRASIGFTSGGAKSNHVGECWPNELSKDKTFEIFIVPMEKDAKAIAGTLTHELVHAAVGLKEGHGKEFRRVAESLGLCGKMTATEEGPAWFEWAQPILDELGAFPGAVLDADRAPRRRIQTTRMLKCTCGGCGFIFRSSRQWLENCELRCPNKHCDGAIAVENIEE